METTKLDLDPKKLRLKPDGLKKAKELNPPQKVLKRSASHVVGYGSPMLTTLSTNPLLTTSISGLPILGTTVGALAGPAVLGLSGLYLASPWVRGKANKVGDWLDLRFSELIDEKGAVAKLFDGMKKWGESGMVGEIGTIMKGILNIWDKATYIPVAAALAMTGAGMAAAALAEIIFQRFNVKNAEKQKVYDAIKSKIQNNAEQVDRTVDFLLNVESTKELLQNQSQLISENIEFTDPRLNRILQNENIYSLLHIDAKEGNDAEKVTASVGRRKNTNALITNLLSSNELGDTENERIRNITTILETKFNDKVVGMTDEQVNKLKEKLKEKDPLLDDYNSPAYAALLEDLRYVNREIRKGRTLADINADLNGIVEVAEKLASNPKALEIYQQSWTTGSAYTIIPFKDNLAVEKNIPEDLRTEFEKTGLGKYNPLMFIGVSVPPFDKLSIEKRYIQLTRMNNNLVGSVELNSMIGNLAETYTNEELERNFSILNNLSRDKVNTLNEIASIANSLVRNNGNSFTFFSNGQEVNVTDSTLIQAVKTLLFSEPNRTLTKDTPIQIQHNKLEGDEVMGKIQRSKENGSEELRALIRKIVDIENDSIVLNDFVLSAPEDTDSNKTVLSMIKDMQPAFEQIYAAYDGDLRHFFDNGVITPPNRVYEHLKKNIGQKTLIAEQLTNLTDSALKALVNTHLSHLDRINNGNIVVLENIENTRDHQGLIDRLNNIAENLLKVNEGRLKEIRDEYEKNGTVIDLSKIRLPRIDPKKPIENLEDYPKLVDLRNEIIKVGAILMTRKLEIVNTYQDEYIKNDTELVGELLALDNQLKTLTILGLYIDRTGDPDKIFRVNDKLLKMYLNGMKLSEGTTENNIRNSLGNSPFHLQSTTSKVNIS